MRRSDREITELATIQSIVQACTVCRVGLAVDSEPYVVPVSFGFDGESVYFHTARDGRKIDMMTANPRVCVQFERGVELVEDKDEACGWNIRYESVIGFGAVVELVDEPAKSRGLNQIMKHYSGRDWEFDQQRLEATRVWRVDLDILTGKRSKAKG
jgi:nitroimidazol reductase NimA-like FMN-containing flavoprotein (pyridoxamine 5'-phosphate oxidase superfamily)